MSIDIQELENAGKGKPVDKFPGWTMYTDGKNRKYVSPGGLTVSNRRFYELKAKYESQGYIPEDDIIPQPAKQQFYSSDQMKTSHPEHQTPPKPTQATDESSRMQWQQQTAFKDDTEHPILGTIKEIADKVPEPEKASNRSYGTNPSEKEIADGLTSAILFAAIIIAMITNLESLAAWKKPMVDQATLPFIRIAKKHGWLNAATARVVAEGDDWAQLGKGLVAMMYPVIMEIQFKHQQKMEEIRLRNQGAPVTNQPAHNPVASNGHQQKADEATWSPGPNLRPTGVPTHIIRPQGGQ